MFVTLTLTRDSLELLRELALDDIEELTEAMKQKPRCVDDYEADKAARDELNDAVERIDNALTS